MFWTSYYVVLGKHKKLNSFSLFHLFYNVHLLPVLRLSTLDISLFNSFLCAHRLPIPCSPFPTCCFLHPSSWSLVAAHLDLLLPFCFPLIPRHMLFITLRYIFFLFIFRVLQCILGYNFLKVSLLKIWNFPSKICATPKVLMFGNSIMCRLGVLFVTIT